MSEAITGDLDRAFPRREQTAVKGSLLTRVNSPADVKALSIPELKQLAEEVRAYLVKVVSRTGGHLAHSQASVWKVPALRMTR